MRWIGLFACALFAACGGGGVTPIVVGGSGPANPGPVNPNPPPAAVTENHVVVRFDINGDDEPDLVTLDADKTPFEVVAALEGTPNGDAVDTTDLRKGEAIDAALSDALSNYLAGSFKAGTQTDLDLEDVNGNTVPVTVFE